MTSSRLAALAIFVLALGSTAPLDAQQASGTAERDARGVRAAGSVRSLMAFRFADAAPVIDGRLDEPLWAAVPVATDFVQREPNAGLPPSQRTEARVAYDDRAVYVAVRLFDTEPHRIVAQLARRDVEVHSEWIYVGFDSYFDRRTAFVFGLNPRGVKRDFVIFDDTNSDDSWDAVWEGAARIDSLGWTAEFRIPLSQLRFAPSPAAGDAGGGEAGSVWGVQFARVIARTGEEAFWAPTPPDMDRIVSLFGELRGLRGLRPQRRLEVQPYTVGRVTRAPDQPGNPFFRRNDPVASAGADIKYGVTSNLTLSATINPDFGQVEADPSQVNLTAFETFFSEQRTFFIESTDIFRFGVGIGGGSESVFYSRRIGRPPQGGSPEGALHSSHVEPAPILAAVKLSGKTAAGWSVGVLDAVTGEQRVRYLLGDGSAGDRIVEPRSNYLVARGSRDFRDGGSAVGVIATATHRDLGPDTRDFLRHAAYTGGVDARHRLGESGNVQLRAWLLGSHVRGSPAAIDVLQRSPARYFQRPDAAHLDHDPARKTLSGGAAMLELTKFGGGRWRWALATNARSPGFELNDIGFLREADAITQIGFLGYEQPRAGPIFRRWQLNSNAWSGWTTGGERTSTGANVNGNFQLNSLWGGYGGVARELEALSPNALRGGPALLRPARTNAWMGVYSDRRKAVRAEVDANVSREPESGSSSLWLGPSVGIRPSARTDLSLRPGWSRSIDAWQFVARRNEADGTPHYIHGRLEQHTLSLTARLAVTFTPELSFQFYGQPFVGAGTFDRFTTVADPRAERFVDRFRVLAPGTEIVLDEASQEYEVDLDGGGPELRFGRPDFTVRELASTSVMRWEYRPGSTLFVVWSQGRSFYGRDGAFDAGRDARRIFGIRPTNVLLVKVSYWMAL